MTLVVFLTYGTSLRDWERMGLLTRELKLYENLVANGWTVTFVTYGNEDDHLVINTKKGMDVLPIFEGTNKPQNKIFRLIKTLWRLHWISNQIPKDSILKCKQMYGAWMPALLSKFTKHHFVFRYGFDDIHFRHKLNQSPTMLAIFKWVTKWSLKQAKHIIITTHHDHDRLKGYLKKTLKQVTIIPNWVNTQSFKKLTFDATTDRLLYVGRLNSQKNLENFIKALKGSRYGLDIFGKGPLEDKLIALAKHNNVDLKIYDPVANSKLPEIYNSYRYFCLPSHFEGNPKVLLEAMACGNIVIGTAVEGIEEIIDHHENGVLVKHDLSDFQDAMNTVNSDQALQEIISKNTIAYINENHRLDKLALREHEILTSLKS